MSRTLFIFMSMMKFWKIFQTSLSYYESFFEKKSKPIFFSITSGAPSNRCATSKFEKFWIFLPLDLESPVSFFLLGFWGFWKCLTGFPPLNSDVTFRVDDFSYKKLFHPSSYAKVMPILRNSREILQIKSKFIFVNFFPTTRPHITWETYFILFFWHFHHFLLFFLKLKRRSGG